MGLAKECFQTTTNRYKKIQPLHYSYSIESFLEDIRQYFGVKIALYFCWLRYEKAALVIFLHKNFVLVFIQKHFVFQHFTVFLFGIIVVKVRYLDPGVLCKRYEMFCLCLGT